MPVKPCPVVFFCAEESMEELHYRVEKIAAPLVSIRPLPKKLRLISGAHSDAELVTFEDGAAVLISIYNEAAERDAAE